MARKKSDQYKNWKVVLLWVLGALFILTGSLIAGHAEIELGTTEGGFLLSIAIAFMLFLLGGLLWVSVAVALKELEER